MIRDATPGDLPRLLELLYQLSQQSRTAEPAPHPESPAHHAMIAAIQADPRASLFVLEDDGRVIGTYTLYLLPNLSHGSRPIAIVENVVIEQSARGGGHGATLMNHARARAREAGCYKISLTSHLNRAPAHAFYERIGFTNSHKGFTVYFDEPEPATG